MDFLEGTNLEIAPEITLPAVLSNACVSVAIRARPEDSKKLSNLGHQCALRALKLLCPEVAHEKIRKGELGEPLWPFGCVGSITHTFGLAWAAVSLDSKNLSMGIDAERILRERSRKHAMRFLKTIAAKEEIEQIEPSLLKELSAEVLATLIFSAKESLYKCLSPLLGQFFWFDAARVNGINLNDRRLTLELLKDLSEVFPRGWRVDCRFAVGDELIITGVELPRSQRPNLSF